MAELLRQIACLWRSFWTKCAGTGWCGRAAGHLASVYTIPYQRYALADFHAKGFTSPRARIRCQKLKRGANVWIGDDVTIFAWEQTGEVQLDDRAKLHEATTIHVGSGVRVRIGSGTSIQPRCFLHAFVSDIVIGEKVDIAANCALYSYDHGFDLGAPITEQPLKSKGPIQIGDGVWIGHGSIILNGVSIGSGAVVGAGAVVVRDIPENAIAVGNPAKVVGYRK